jgi:hypothetical protein
MTELQGLEQELKIAIEHNFDKQEIENLKRLIEVKKVKQAAHSICQHKYVGYSVTEFFRRILCVRLKNLMKLQYPRVETENS